MGDPVPVVPRFSEQPVAQPVYAPPNPAPAPQADVGLFTSFYENRTIVFLIVITVMLLGFVAMWISKKDPADDPPKAIQGAGTPIAQPVANTQTAPAQMPVQPAPQETKEDLENLLSQARAQTPALAPEPTPPPAVYNSKSDAEIMHLMEDTLATPSTNNVTQCSTIIPPNRQCKNPAVLNGKCIQHDKA